MSKEQTNPSGSLRAKEVTAAIKSATASAQPQTPTPPWEPLVRPVVQRGPARTPETFRAPPRTPDTLVIGANSNSIITPPAANDAMPTPWTAAGLVPDFVRAPDVREDDEALASDELWIMLDQDTGLFMLSRLDEPLAESAMLIAYRSHFEWVHFIDNKPETIPLDPNKPFPKRSELQPPKPADPNAIDPVALRGWLNLVDPTSGDNFAFFTTAAYGRGAIDTLMRRVEREQQNSPGACPVIKFKSYQVKKAAYRPFWAPRFVIVGWVMPDGTWRTVP